METLFADYQRIEEAQKKAAEDQVRRRTKARFIEEEPQRLAEALTRFSQASPEYEA